MKSTEKKFHALVDSDMFTGWVLNTDPHHKNAVALFKEVGRKNLHLVTTNLVIAETATVLSHRSGQDLARVFLAHAEKFSSIFVTEELHQESLTLFKEQTTKNTSVVDCSNVVVLRHFHIPQILSFDKFYSKRFALKTAA